MDGIAAGLRNVKIAKSLLSPFPRRGTTTTAKYRCVVIIASQKIAKSQNRYLAVSQGGGRQQITRFPEGVLKEEIQQ